jgi:GNAT superfamily N-acetyltransferase
MLALSPEEIFDEVMVAPRHSFPTLPDMRVVERPGWVQIITPSITTGGLNEVAYSALADGEADAIIDATIAEYRALGLKFRWNAGPGSAPADLGERLARRGLVASWGRGMARATDAAEGAIAAGIRIERVDDATVGLFSQVMAEGWNLEAAALARVNELILAAPARQNHLFLAHVDGEPAACASYVALARSAYLIGGVVLPRFQRRGLYRALVEARMADAHACGLALATSHARESTAAPILERLGFDTICRFPMYFG